MSIHVVAVLSTSHHRLPRARQLWNSALPSWLLSKVAEVRVSPASTAPRRSALVKSALLRSNSSRVPVLSGDRPSITQSFRTLPCS